MSGLITSIATQTDRLPINVPVEAARAASAGKGFVIVVAEVKNLAQQPVLPCSTNSSPRAPETGPSSAYMMEPCGMRPTSGALVGSGELCGG